MIDSVMKYSHATALLVKLHWLSITVRVLFNTQLPTHRALTGHAPEYIKQRVSGRQAVRSLRLSEYFFAITLRS